MSQITLADKGFKVAMLVKMPAQMRCYQCEEDYRFKRKFGMYICSTQKIAEIKDVVIWKCKKCGKSKAERVDKNDGGRFWFEAKKMNLVHVEG